MHLSKTSLWLAILIGLAFLGFVDATFLTVNHFMHQVPACSFVAGCELVLTSRYSMVGPIPTAMLGELYYATIILVGVNFFGVCRLPVRLLFGITGTGLVASGWFVVLQLFVVKAICQYCMASAAISTLLFIITGCLFLSKKQGQTA